jgi:hypothetical protein
MGIGVASAFLSIVVLLASCSKSNPVTAPSTGVPTLSLPSNGAANIALFPSLTWSTVSNASSYSLQVSTSATFATLVASDSAITATTAIANGLADSTTYYWRIRATGTSGVGNWSGAWNFKVVADTTLIQGSWLGSDPSGSGFWLYSFKGDSIAIAKILISSDTLGNSIYDTLPTYWGHFALDAPMTANTTGDMDIHLTTPAYSGQTIKTLYDYEGVQGSFIGCIILINTPGTARPTAIADTNSNYMEMRYQFVY